LNTPVAGSTELEVTSGETLGQQAWDRLLLAQPGASLLQSWAWGSLQSRFGWSLERLAFDGGSSGVCSLQKARGLLPGGAVYYVPRGPAVPIEKRAAALQELDARARRGSGTVLQVEPEASEQDGWRPVLISNRFMPGKAVQPEATQLLPIDRDPEHLKAGFKPKTRYNLALAQKKGVNVSRSRDIQTFARLSAETARRQRIHLPGAAYYLAALELFEPQDAVRLYFAQHEGSTLAAIMVFRFGTTAHYLFGASSFEKRELMPNYLLHWTAMLDFRELGCTTYDWWGIPQRPAPDHPWYGLHRFKTSFGGETVSYIGLYQRVLHPARWRWEGRLRKLKDRLRRPILG
jgi:lipid II:glycine glycyltransferase (peptidoglycan interpeptide bridge formation enzyme)